MTIEERAKEYAPDTFDPDYILPAREGYIVSLQRRAYIVGAKEQKQIDIDKACELLKSVGVLTDDDSIMGFIKAMGEDL